MNNSLAIIPARGGSKRIPKKNIKSFCGKPALGHVLENIKQSEVFREIHVSTENEEIFEVAKSFGCEPCFLRDPNLADDFTPILPVLRFVLDQYYKLGFEFDTIALITPLSLLLGPDDIEAAMTEFLTGDRSKPLICVSEYPAPIEWAFELDEKTGNLTPRFPGSFSMRSQDIESTYFDVGVLEIYSKEALIDSSGAGDDSWYRGYCLPRDKAVDIDSEADWEFAEKLFMLKHGGNS